ncbi:hypothetical protein EDC04DRAFT_2604756 [Pisolithus marmoratus]|nr:hypothetical protein EDC04DRAFT_2604756 [Pisolithus marmoratus]
MSLALDPLADPRASLIICNILHGSLEEGREGLGHSPNENHKFEKIPSVTDSNISGSELLPLTLTHIVECTCMPCEEPQRPDGMRTQGTCSLPTSINTTLVGWDIWSWRYIGSFYLPCSPDPTGTLGMIRARGKALWASGGKLAHGSGQNSHLTVTRYSINRGSGDSLQRDNGAPHGWIFEEDLFDPITHTRRNCAVSWLSGIPATSKWVRQAMSRLVVDLYILYCKVSGVEVIVQSDHQTSSNVICNPQSLLRYIRFVSTLQILTHPPVYPTPNTLVNRLFTTELTRPTATQLSAPTVHC